MERDEWKTSGHYENLVTSSQYVIICSSQRPFHGLGDEILTLSSFQFPKNVQCIYYTQRVLQRLREFAE